MLSILLPVYNFDIRKLVQDLHRQCTKEGIPFEILCYDDVSTESFRQINASVASLAQVTYVELEKNVGRSRIRNILGQAAQYDYLLFMDCDSEVISGDYIRLYLQELDKQAVLCGGREYSEKPPKSLDHYFHWFYGSRREQRLASERAVAPYNSFLTCQFVIPKAVFLSILFEESIREYGHEDTLFGLELKQREIPVKHLNNPLRHVGLEKTQVFLDKSRQAIENLGKICKENRQIETRLLDTYLKVNNMGLSTPIEAIGNLSEPAMIKNFHSSRPNLHFFDLYKLSYLIKVMNDKEEKLSSIGAGTK